MSKESRFPLGGEKGGEGRATATCYCGTVSLEFSTRPPDLGPVIICHCTDCHKITSSLFTTLFYQRLSAIVHLRGQDSLTQFTQSKTIQSGREMTNYFCKICGTLMYRRGLVAEGWALMRAGTVDDFGLKEGVLRPTEEIFCEEAESFLGWVEGTVRYKGQRKAKM